MNGEAQAAGTVPRAKVLLAPQLRKGRPTMHPSPTYASTPLPNSDQGRKQSKTTEDRVYQGFSIAAMLLLLISLWLF
jgi:hypothetical protein